MASVILLTLKRANIGNSIYRTIGDEAKLQIKDIIWYVRHQTPSFDNIALVSNHLLSGKNTDYSLYITNCISKTSWF